MHSIDLNPPTGEDRRTVYCVYCHMPQPVSRKAMTLTCKYCNKVLKLEEVRIKDYQARRSIETGGALTVEKKGQVITERILCAGLVARGRIKGNIVSHGPVMVGPDAEIVGDVTAPTIAVGDGAVLEGRYDIRPSTLPDPIVPPGGKTDELEGAMPGGSGAPEEVGGPRAAAAPKPAPPPKPATPPAKPWTPPSMPPPPLSAPAPPLTKPPPPKTPYVKPPVFKPLW